MRRWNKRAEKRLIAFARVLEAVRQYVKDALQDDRQGIAQLPLRSLTIPTPPAYATSWHPNTAGWTNIS